MKKILFKILILLGLFNAFLFGDTVSCTLSETIEVSLDSFSAFGILLMIVLTSLLGVFFVKDEFC